MPFLDQKSLAAAVTGTGAQQKVDVRNLTALSIFGKATGGTSVTFTVEVTADPAGALGWATAGVRPPGNGSYVTTGQVVAAGAGVSLFLAPEDNVAWVRLNVSANSSSLDAYLNGEA
jgi:hypothetical protein